MQFTNDDHDVRVRALLVSGQWAISGRADIKAGMDCRQVQLIASRTTHSNNIPTQSSSTATTQPTATKMPFFSRKPTFSASTTTLTSVISTSSASSDASTPTLLKQSRPEKDYFAASGALQTSYGFGGAALALPTMPKSSKSAKTKSAKVQEPAVSPGARTQKDYEAAYGALSSTYGFGGAAFAPTSASK